MATYANTKELLKHIKVGSRSTIINLVNKGLLPPPIRLGGQNLWDLDIVDTHLARLREEQEQERAVRAEADAIAAARRAERLARRVRQ